uniref:Uncharacterized protein n=1 Tax=Octopus bimaculoides TaxID=37653 RepID=A0A0L8HF00_OCTBM
MRTTAEQAISCHVTGISNGVFKEILTVNPNIERVALKFVPRFFAHDNNQQQRVDIYLEVCRVLLK